VHTGNDAKAKLIATARTAARPIREAAPDVPRAVAAVIDRALAFHKQERWPDAHAMREALRWARMSIEDQPSQTTAATSEPELEEIPPPVPTRRAIDDEPTMLRKGVAAPRSEPPRSNDFLTSAPPITLRDIPKSTGAEPPSMGPVFSLHNDPVFSLRREKDEIPSTERIPADAGSDLDSDSDAEEATREVDRFAHAKTMPFYDPSDTLGADAPISSRETAPGTVDVNLSFTRPMATVAMPPEHEAPRPAGGGPSTYPGLGPTHMPAQPPPPAPPLYAHPHAVPQPSSAPPAAFPQMPTGPSLRVLAAASSRPSLAPDAPGPLLSEIVMPSRGRAARILVPLGLALVIAAGVFVFMRTRAANARASAGASATAAGGSASGATTAALASSIAPAPPAANVPVVPSAAPAPIAASPAPRPR
jgi:serine/threonine-protein kinase